MKQSHLSGAMQIQLVACDIDGTLLHDDETCIHPEVLIEIDRLHKKGIYFCPTSGRQYNSLKHLFAPVVNDIYFICENGAILYKAGTPDAILSKTNMPDAKAKALCADILATPGCELVISGANTSYVCPKSYNLASYLQEYNGNNTARLTSVRDMPEDIIKVAAYCDNSAELYDAPLGQKWRDCFHVAIAGEKWLDFTVSNKGTGLRSLCTVLDIPLSNVMAIGDNYNDLPMLERVGRPVIMENAAEDLKTLFTEHCIQVEDLLRTL